MITCTLPTRTIALTFAHQNIYAPKDGKPVKDPIDLDLVSRQTCCLILAVPEGWDGKVRRDAIPLPGAHHPSSQADGHAGGWTILAEGTATCALKYDNFRKAVGRKLALTRALACVGPGNPPLTNSTPLFSKEERFAIWSAYLER